MSKEFHKAEDGEERHLDLNSEKNGNLTLSACDNAPRERCMALIVHKGGLTDGHILGFTTMSPDIAINMATALLTEAYAMNERHGIEN